MAWPEYKKNMRGDPFNHIISVGDSDGNVREHIAGANNIFVARRAFEHLLYYYNELDVLTLREGAHIICEERGDGGWHKAFLARTIGIKSADSEDEP